MADLISRAALLNDLSYCAPELWQDEEYIKAKIMKQPVVDAAPVVMAGAELTDAELIEKIRKAPIVLKPNVDAIPVEWVRNMMVEREAEESRAAWLVLREWKKEQEART